VGWAIIDYLKNGRPVSDFPNVFLRHLAPVAPFSDEDHLPGYKNKPMTIPNIEKNHRKFLWQAKISHPGRSKAGERGAPCVHSYRHTFAVHRLREWMREWKNIQAYMPVLQAYMGHFKKAPKTLIHYLTVEQTKLLLEQPDKQTKNGRRDMVLLSVLYDTGARVQEICDLRVRDVRLEPPALITLTGKGCKSRYVPLQKNTVNLLQKYMQEHALLSNGKQDMPLFHNQRYAALTRGGINHILQKYVDKASLKCPDMPKKATPHILRHSKATHLLQAGINIVMIRDILGTCINTDNRKICQS
jgi:site-specific recombinase XerD